MEFSIADLEAPFNPDAVQFIRKMFRTVFPESVLPERVKLWPKEMDSKNNQPVLNFKAATKLHQQEKEKLLNRMVILLKESEQNKDPTFRHFNGLRNLEEYEAKRRENFFRRLPSRLARSGNNAMFTYLRKQRKKERDLADAAKPAERKRLPLHKTDYATDAMQQYFDCCQRTGK